jgi:alcohol dehydrogenase, propanol-preferring
MPAVFPTPNSGDMRAMILNAPGAALREEDVRQPEPAAGQVLVRVGACAVCRTDLHVLDGELKHPKLPLILGHEIAGQVAAVGPGATRFKTGDRVGIPWLGWTCGHCPYCQSGRENLCEQARFTGYTLDGGYAEYTVADERFCFPIPGAYSDADASPLLCAGLIGYRCLLKTGNAKNVGIYGFGGAAHIVAQLALHEGRRIFAFTREGDSATQQFARSLGAAWAGSSDAQPPEPLDAAIIFAPAGELVPQALKATARGGCVVCGGIHMSDIPAFSYDILWQERTVCSVANLTRRDGEAFLSLAPSIPIRTEIRTFPLEEANAALAQLRAGAFRGSAVLMLN